MRRLKIPTEVIWKDYQITRSVWATGENVGLAGQTVQERLRRAGYELDGHGKPYTKEEDSMIRQVYAFSPGLRDLNLKKLAKVLGREHTNVCRRAKQLELTSATRKLTVPQRDVITSRQIANIKQGVLPGTFYPNVQKGWAKFSGNRQYFLKSGWELSYANYLEMLLQAKAIGHWEYEPDTFWFEKIMRGVRSYTPDFKIFLQDDTVEYHEVKGYMDAKSKTKLNRMRIYHPNVKMVVIDRKALKGLGVI